MDEESFISSVSMQHGGADTVLELYRASQIRMNEEETILEKINGWTKPFLKKQLLNRSIQDKRLEKQVLRSGPLDSTECAHLCSGRTTVRVY